MKFKSQVDMDSGLKYQAIKSGKVDAIDIFTTDGQLYGANLVVLKDDKKSILLIRQEQLFEKPL